MADQKKENIAKERRVRNGSRTNMKCQIYGNYCDISATIVDFDFHFFSGTWDNEQAQKDIEFFLNQFVHTKSTNYLEKFFGRQGRNLADKLGNIKNVARVLSGWLLYC